MAEEQEVRLEFEPVYVPPEMILSPWTPILKPPEEEIIIPIKPTAKKRLIINIEASGFNPLENRIISIGIQDPEFPSDMPFVIMLSNEADMLNALFTVIREGGYDEIVGYGLSFDYRFILLRAMYHRIACKEFYNMTLYDLMQAVAQGKFSFVYFPQKALPLSDVADLLWGYPKPFTDLEMLKYWKSGALDKVVEFTSSQITRILALYLLFRAITETLFTPQAAGVGGSPLSPIPPMGESAISGLTIPEAHASTTRKYKCPLCLAEFEEPITKIMNICPICGSKLEVMK